MHSRNEAGARDGRPVSSQRAGVRDEGRLSANSLAPYSTPMDSTKLKDEAGAVRNSAQR